MQSPNFEGTEYNSYLLYSSNCKLTFKKETLFDKLSLLFLHQIYEALTVNAYGLCTCLTQSFLVAEQTLYVVLMHLRFHVFKSFTRNVDDDIHSISN